jgi:multidrug efflux pump subunit AcrA (membrane-fusion protein)
MNKSRIRILSINLVLALVVIGIGWWGWSALHPAAAKVTTTTTSVSVGDVTSSVSASGTVVSPGDVGVSPSVSAQITKINVKVGQKVLAGTSMAQLDNATLKNALSQAQATLLTAQINFKQTKAAIQTAKDTAANNATTYQNTVDSARRAIDDASASSPYKATANKATLDAALQTLNQAKSVYDSYAGFYGPNGITLAWCATLNTINSNCTTLISDYNSYQSAQRSYDAAVANQASTAISDTSTSISLQNSWTSALASQRIGLAKDQSSISAAQDAYDLFKAQQGVTTDNPTALDFSVAQTGLLVAQKNFEATFVRAPVSGRVASISAGLGQNAPTASSSTLGAVSGFIVLTDVSSLQVSASFSEADSAKLAVGQDASFSFSALSNVSAVGKVISIDPLPTTTSGATSYKALFTITDKIPTLKPGMTTTVTVTTGAAFNVLQVASQAITTRGGLSILNVITNKNGKEVTTPTPVVVGLKGDATDQIISGVSAGTKVVLRTTSATATTNGFPTTTGGLGGAVAGPGGGGAGRGFGG